MTTNTDAPTLRPATFTYPDGGPTVPMPDATDVYVGDVLVGRVQRIGREYLAHFAGARYVGPVGCRRKRDAVAVVVRGHDAARSLGLAISSVLDAD